MKNLKILIVCAGVSIITASIVGVRLNTQKEVFSVSVNIEALTSESSIYKCSTNSGESLYFIGNNMYTSTSQWCNYIIQNALFCINSYTLFKNGVMVETEWDSVICI
jgi:hypothetical protein